MIEEHRSSEVVALQLRVKAGGRDETASERGLAHYLEDMPFQGTASRPRGFIQSEVEGVGGRMNAGASVRRRQSVALSPPPTLRGGLPKALREPRRAVSAAEARRAFLTETAGGRAAEQLRETIVVVKPRS